MRHTSRIIAALLGLLILSGCANQHSNKQYFTIDGFGQGTTYHFVIETDDTTGLQKDIDKLLLDIDNSMSLYTPNSLVNRLNRNQTDSLDSYITYCINTAYKVSEESDGLYDITIKPITAAFGFTGSQQVDRPNIDSLLQFVGYKKISISDGKLIKQNPGMQIDLNSLAQGYSADLLAELMESRGINQYMVEIGGELFARGKNAQAEDWRVGIDKPFDGNFVPGEDLQVIISITDKGLATSGNYRKFHPDENGNKVVHIINPKTGKSTESNLLSATVIADNATLADIYGTMMMVMGLEHSKEFLANRTDLMGYLIYADSTGKFATYYSPSLKNKIKENN